MRIFSRSEHKSPGNPDIRDDKLNALIEKLGIGGANAMNITWEELANILVFLLEAEARRMGEGEPGRTGTRDRGGNGGKR